MTRLPRVYAVVDQKTVDQLDDDAKKLAINRSQWILQAIKAYLLVKGDEWIKEKTALQQQLGDTKTELSHLQEILDDTAKELKKIKGSRLLVDTEVTHLREESEHAKSEVAQLKLQLNQATDLKDDLEQLKARYDQSLLEATQRWEELKGYKSEVSKLKKQLEESQTTILHLKDDLLNRQSETDQLSKTREELAAIRAERNKLQEALKVRDEDVAWLRSHVAQLTQQLALPPSEEEAIAKHWYQFWK